MSEVDRSTAGLSLPTAGMCGEQCPMQEIYTGLDAEDRRNQGTQANRVGYLAAFASFCASDVVEANPQATEQEVVLAAARVKNAFAAEAHVEIDQRDIPGCVARCVLKRNDPNSDCAWRTGTTERATKEITVVVRRTWRASDS